MTEFRNILRYGFLAALFLSATSLAVSDELTKECGDKTLEVQKSYDNIFARLRQMVDLREECAGTGIYEARSALLFADARRLDEAETMIAAASLFSPAYDKEVLVAKMSLAVPQGRREDALLLGKQVVTEFPTWLDGYTAYAMAHFWNADFSSSINVLNKASLIDESGKAYRLLAVMYYLEENYPSSVDSLERALEIDPDAILDVSAATSAALSLLEMGQRDDGLALLQRYAAADPLADVKSDYIRARKRFEPKPRQRAIVAAATISTSSATPVPGPVIDPNKVRTRDEVEYGFDKNKGAIFALYNRALRVDPTLEGRVVVRIGIQPSGEISSCNIESSDFTNTEFFDRLCERIRLIEFTRLAVSESTTILKSINFIRD